MTEFVSFQKIARLNREVVVTEKIDGTNAQIFIGDDFTTIKAGSRNRWVVPGDDNHGWARWVEEHKEELLKLGPGTHYGEWWGPGIGPRKYGIPEKRFSLFNVAKWSDPASRPACCHVVPELARGPLAESVATALQRLRETGSVAAPGFMKPEGIVIFHTAASQLFKVTLENDEVPKGMAQ